MIKEHVDLKKNHPLISVLIPNYNHEFYLKQRIETVLQQTFQDFEIIILDDCSTDNSRDVIESYRNNSKVSHILYNNTNSGSTFKQWKKGTQLAVGDWIWIAESDDWCEQSLLEALVDGVKNNDNCTLAFTQSTMITNDGTIIYQSSHSKLFEYIDGIDFIRSKMLRRNAIINASMAIFKKDAFYKFKDEFTQFKFCGDWLFWIEVAKLGHVFVSGKVLNYFRKHEKDVSGHAYATGLNYVEEIKLLKLLKESCLVNEEEYNKVLVEKFFSYQQVKHAFSTVSKAEIETAFFGDDMRFKKRLLKSYVSKVSKENVKKALKKFIPL